MGQTHPPEGLDFLVCITLTGSVALIPALVRTAASQHGTDRQTGRQTGRETDSQADRQTDRQTDTHKTHSPVGLDFLVCMTGSVVLIPILVNYYY